MFYDINDSDIAGYTDDNTPYASTTNLGAVVNKLLEESTNNLSCFNWFRKNHMKANAGICHLPIADNYEVSASINEIWNWKQ